MDNFNFSSKSIIIMIITLFFSCFQVIVYRKIINSEKELLFYQEIKIFCWRIQTISMMYFIFIFIANFFIKHNLIEERRTINSDFSNIHMIKINFKEIITKNNLKNSLFFLLSSFLFLLSTKYISFSICFIFSHSGEVYNYLTARGLKNKLLKFLLLSFIIFGGVLIYSVMHSLDHSNPHFLLGVVLAIMSSLLNFFLQRNIILQNIKTISPIEMIAKIFVNSLFLSTIILIVSIIIDPKLQIYDLFGWVFSPEIAFYLGFLGIGHLLFTIYSSIYLKPYLLKINNILEIPLSDILAIFVFNMYRDPQNFTYYIGMIHFIITIALVEFSNYTSNKNKIKYISFKDLKEDALKNNK